MRLASQALPLEFITGNAIDLQRSSASTDSSTESNRSNVHLRRQQLGDGDDRRGEDRTDEEANKGDGDGGNNELRYQPEDQLETDGNQKINADGQSFADFGSDESENDAADGDAEPKPGSGHAGGEGSPVSHADHEVDDPASERYCGTQ